MFSLQVFVRFLKRKHNVHIRAPMVREIPGNSGNSKKSFLGLWNVGEFRYFLQK